MQEEGVIVLGTCLVLARLYVGGASSWSKAFAGYGGACVAYAGTFWAACDFTTTGLKGTEVITLGDKLIH